MGKAKLAFGLDLKKRRLNAGLSQVGPFAHGPRIRERNVRVSA